MKQKVVWRSERSVDMSVTPVDLEGVLSAVASEVRRAEKLWPEWQVGDEPEDQYWNLGIIAEELGECFRVLNDAMNQKVHKKIVSTYSGASYDKRQLYKELVQTAAMCVRTAANL